MRPPGRRGAEGPPEQRIGAKARLWVGNGGRVYRVSDRLQHSTTFTVAINNPPREWQPSDLAVRSDGRPDVRP